MRTAVLALVSLALAAPALASDGVLEINQACAVETGCFAGDTAGFPVTIGGASGRSYRLTSALSTGGATIVGIEISATRTTIDLNGFGINGSSAGSANDSGHGISGAASASYATIKNGSLRGHRGWGIALGGAKGVRVENMTIEFNAGGGGAVGDSARVLRNTFSRNGGISNGGIGLLTGNGALIAENVSNESGGTGIETGSGSTVTENTANDNGAIGIEADIGSTVSGNSTYQNGSIGISANASNIAGNTTTQNGSYGISAGVSSIVSGNSVSLNDLGIVGGGAGGASTYRANTITNNATGAVSTLVIGPGMVNQGDNYCEGINVVAPTCP
jgi:hypothetical protein